MVNFLLFPFVNAILSKFDWIYDLISYIWSIIAGPAADHISDMYVLLLYQKPQQSKSFQN